MTSAAPRPRGTCAPSCAASARSSAKTTTSSSPCTHASISDAPERVAQLLQRVGASSAKKRLRKNGAGGKQGWSPTWNYDCEYCSTAGGKVDMCECCECVAHFACAAKHGGDSGAGTDPGGGGATFWTGSLEKDLDFLTGWHCHECAVDAVAEQHDASCDDVNEWFFLLEDVRRAVAHVPDAARRKVLEERLVVVEQDGWSCLSHKLRHSKAAETKEAGSRRSICTPWRGLRITTAS